MVSRDVSIHPAFKTIPQRKQAAKQHLVRGELKNTEVCGCITTIRSVITVFTPEICIKKDKGNKNPQHKRPSRIVIQTRLTRSRVLNYATVMKTNFKP